jgi:hypothetical protein
MSLQDEGIDRLNEIVQKQKSIAERIGVLYALVHVFISNNQYFHNRK